jgi:hypothetical protein
MQALHPSDSLSNGLPFKSIRIAYPNSLSQCLEAC